jgi:hypothetical protein
MKNLHDDGVTADAYKNQYQEVKAKHCDFAKKHLKLITILKKDGDTMKSDQFKRLTDKKIEYEQEMKKLRNEIDDMLKVLTQKKQLEREHCDNTGSHTNKRNDGKIFVESLYEKIVQEMEKRKPYLIEFAEQANKMPKHDFDRMIDKKMRQDDKKKMAHMKREEQEKNRESVKLAREQFRQQRWMF